MATAGSALGQNSNQFYLAAQYDWGAARGFFFAVEGTPGNKQPANLDSAHLILGVGDGHNWHFITGSTAWTRDTRYETRAVIQNGSAEITLNGRRLAKMDCQFVPATGPMLYDQQSSVERAPAAYSIKQKDLQVGSAGKSIQLLAGSKNGSPASGGATLAPQLLLLNPAAGGPQADIKTGNSITIQAAFEFSPRLNARALAPFIDQYGQSIQANWPEKVRSDADLKSAAESESSKFAQWGPVKKFDRYGGLLNAPWTQKPTGFFYVIKHNGKDWLITPLGNPCFYIGVCDAPAPRLWPTPVEHREYLYHWLPSKTGQFAAAWSVNPWGQPNETDVHYFAFHTANLIRKFGDDWQTKANHSAVERAQMLGFSGFGKWSEGHLGVPDLPVLFPAAHDLVKHPDIFDPAVRQQLTQSLHDQIDPRKNDPWLLGWSIGNEQDEEIKPDEITQILSMNDSTPAKRAFLEMARRDGFSGALSTPENIEKLRQYYESELYKFFYTTVKSIDPNHLYFGSWVTPNWWINETDWKIDAANSDVVGFDWYAHNFGDPPAPRLIALSGKPVLCGEFSFPPTYSGQRGYGTYNIHSQSDADEGQMYTRWIQDAAKNKQCVGVFYFQYRDQPLTGRGPGDAPDSVVIGEDYAFGLVDVTDRIKWDFAEQVRKANLAAAQERVGSKN